MPALLKHGTIGAMGGKRKGAGRPMNWQKKMAEDLIRNRKLLPRLADWAEGKEIFTKIDTSGISHKVAADPGIQVFATEKLMDRAWGKSRQEVDVTGVNSIDLSAAFAMVLEARKLRGLPED